jgi:hypothetical protein
MEHDPACVRIVHCIAAAQHARTPWTVFLLVLVLVVVLGLLYFENENDDAQGRVLRSAKRAALSIIIY